MENIALNTVYNVYMYEHAVIHVPCRKATYIHLWALYVAYHKIALDWIEHTGYERSNDSCD